MSEVRKETIICPHCQAKGKMDIWSSVNVDLDPKLRKKIFNDELFLYHCPNCGEETGVPYGTLYHDMTHHFMLFFDFFVPDDYDYEPINIPILPGNKDYIYRHVIGLWRLKEKILILEKGLNDIAIERMKYMLTHVLHPELSEKRTEVFFGDVKAADEETSNDERTMVFWFKNENDETMVWSASMDTYYEHCLACELDPRMKTETCVNIDEGWMERQMKKATV